MVECGTAAFEALRAAEIRPERQGVARARRLSPDQRQLYLWIMREFAAATPPTAETTRAAADARGLDAADAFRVLAREDLVHVDAIGHLAENPSVSGHPISLPEAIEAGRIVFGDLLRED
jgi:hypothetical protein